MLQIHQVQAFSDNYIWIISDGTSAWVVDPGDSVPVIAFLDKHRLSLSGILLTHWHGDHQGGVEDLRLKYGECRVIGSNKILKGPSRAVSEGQIIDVLGATFKVIEESHVMADLKDRSSHGQLFSFEFEANLASE